MPTALQLSYQRKVAVCKTRMAEVDNFHVYILFNSRTIETRKPFPEPEIDAINEEGEEIN